MFWKNKRLKTQKYPHEVLPEIVHWEEGDKIEGDGEFFCSYKRFKRVTEDGKIILSNFGDLFEYRIEDARDHMFNRGLLGRKININLESDQYQQFLKDFRKAYSEISA